MGNGNASWFERNQSCVWTGGGCCGCLLLLLLVLVGLPLGGGVALFQGLKSSPVYQQAVEAAQQDPRLIEALGEPIETGLAFSGSINTSGSSGEADYSIPLKGPEGRAKLFAVATKTAGIWRFELLEAALEETNERIDLLPTLPPEIRSLDPESDGEPLQIQLPDASSNNEA